MQKNELNEYQDNGRLSHAYIAAPSLAESIAMAAVCSAQSGAKPCKICINCSKASRGIHPDIIYMHKPDGKREIVVDQIRDLKKNSIVVPNDADKKVYVVKDANLMNDKAQNACLQLLEEPPSHAVFILSTESPAALLDTIRSRCVELKSPPQPDTANHQADAIADEFFTALESGNMALASFMFTLEKLDKDAMSNFLACAKAQTALRLKTAGNGTQGIMHKKLSKAGLLLTKAGEMLDFNVASGHISGMLCASLIEIEN